VVDQAISPEVRAQSLFRDRYIGVARVGHPLCEGEVTAARFAAATHVHVSRREGDTGCIDQALAAMGLQRQVTTVVGGFSAALALVRASNVVAWVHKRHTGVLYAGMHSFNLPLPLAPFTVCMLWHPRMDGDPAHRWLRGCVRDACAEQQPAATTPAH
jgi:DNA-binding transcriptional LysR family regulator